MDKPEAHSADDSWLTTSRFALFLGLLVFVTFSGVALGTQTFIFRDYGLFSYPAAFFQRECFWHGELPLWNPYNQCGLPFLAQWNTMCLYPPALLYLLLPLTWGLSFFCLAHLIWGGLGMYLLARQWTGNRLAGGVAGIIFTFNGLSLNFLMWPSHVATFSWLPWILWLAPRGWREGGCNLIWATLAGALQMLAGGPETILLTWMVLALLAAGDWFQRTSGRKWIAWRFFGMAVLVALLCSAQLLPFLELLAHSQRDSGYSSSAHNWSMPFWGWANFLVPLFRTGPTSQGVCFQNGQYWTSSYYAGIGTVLLGAVSAWRMRDWRVRLLTILIFLGLVLSWGDTSVVFCALKWCVPGLGLVRYPVKFVILVLALAPLLAAFGIAALASRGGKAGRFEWGFVFVMLMLIGGIIGVERNGPLDVWRMTWHNGLARAGFLILIFFLVMFALRAQNQRSHLRPIWYVLLLFAFWLDFRTHVPNQNPTASPVVYARESVRHQRLWNPEPRLGASRTMLSAAVRGMLSQNPLADPEQNYKRNRLAARGDANLLDELPQIDSFFSLTPRQVNTVVARLYARREHDFSSLLDFLAVSQLTADSHPFDWVSRPTAMPLVTAGQEPIFANDPTSFAAISETNIDFRHTVFLPLESQGAITAMRQVEARVDCTEFTNRKITMDTHSGAACLVTVSQAWYPVWGAYVDGEPAKLWRANYAFQALQVPAGNHRVQLRYEDRAFRVGVFLSCLGSIAGIAVCASGKLRLLMPRGSRSG